MLRIKLLVLALFAAFAGALLLTDNSANPHARAYSSGPPAGFTHAPGELDCADCHTTPAPSSGTLLLGVPTSTRRVRPTTSPSRTLSADPTRVRWGFQMTALDSADEKAGSLRPGRRPHARHQRRRPVPGARVRRAHFGGDFPRSTERRGLDVQVGGAVGGCRPRHLLPRRQSGQRRRQQLGRQHLLHLQVRDLSGARARLQRLARTRPRARSCRARPRVTTSRVTPLNGFAGTVTLAASGLPPGVSLTPASVHLLRHDAGHRHPVRHHLAFDAHGDIHLQHGGFERAGVAYGAGDAQRRRRGRR